MGKLTIYDITKENYSKVKGDDNKMWESTKFISDVMCEKCNMSEEEYWQMLKEYYALLVGYHYNENFAMWQIKQMYFIDNANVRHDSPYWTMPQIESVYKSIKSKLKYDYNVYDFAVTLEMIRSDNYCLYKNYFFPNATEEELTEKFILSAISYLNDDDNTDGKIFKYFLNK